MLGIMFSGCSVKPQQDAGIEGRVMRSPTCPGPVRPGRICEAPFSAVFFVQDREGQQVATFETDTDGRFRVSLPSGAYTVVPSDEAPVRRGQAKDVTVADEDYTQLSLVFDTGIR